MKKDCIQWSALEGNWSLDTKNKSSDGIVDQNKVKEKHISTVAKKEPKDWDFINKFLDPEFGYLKCDYHPLHVYLMLYNDAADDVKKAMNKSMQQSGGTVLSM